MRGGELQLHGLRKAFGDRLALDDLSLTVPPGRVVGLLGPNGSGKTTAIRTVFGVIDADAGSVTYRGAPLGLAERRRFGYMPEERGLYPGMAVREQVVYFGRLFGLGGVAAGRRADALLERLGLGERADERLERLSLGNQQRVQLAVALVHEPEALVLDEPFSGLDPVAVADLSQIIRDAADEGCPVLFSSHQLDLVEHVCDSACVIDGGRTVLEGEVAALRRASGRRVLRVDTASRAWVARLDGGVRVVGQDAAGVRLSLAPGVDPLEVLDAARADGPVEDFSLDAPSLADLFLEAVGKESR